MAASKHQRLESEYHLMCDVTENATNLLGMNTPLGIVGVIDNEADRMSGMVSADRNLCQSCRVIWFMILRQSKLPVVDESVEDILRCAA